MTTSCPIEFLEGFPKAKALLLWECPKKSGGVLALTTMMYFLMELSGYTMLSLFSTILLFAVIASFVWASIARITNRDDMKVPLVPELDEKSKIELGNKVQSSFNKLSVVCNKILTGSNPWLTLQAAGFLFTVSKIGAFFHFWTLVFQGVLLSFTIPKIYQLKKTEIDQMVGAGRTQINAYYMVLKGNVLGKIGGGKAKAEEKKQ
mmetsp:Transcript_4859/g.6578  ORF Transcript_4859/g.6578 Transcript_4859/m.6578 type:complete len:205 (-) Transcript_4859:280-894(-)|eukprot:CAMPEP_0196581388 /NCGR_PEP_ID=MMETSP1081-20130531/33925_1 /TAXON_ID=36882 /ORGANISM="Pyramimonas amylifera, Strain CCMP720" /LENGTH=204 /DNA_ID=CAMNT_0041901601 /DNA_START=124 /DNA_END=738 /DNA_ORIENTATION=-